MWICRYIVYKVWLIEASCIIYTTEHFAIICAGSAAQSGRWKFISSVKYSKYVCVMMMKHHYHIAIFLPSAANLCILMVWDAANGPWLQALHLFFALGALTGPLLVRPFLKEVSSEKEHENQTVSFATTRSSVTVIATDDRAAVENSTSSPQYADLGTGVWIPFLLLGVIGVIIACFFIGLYCTKSTEWSNTRKKEDKVQEQHLPKNKVIKKIPNIFCVYVLYLPFCYTDWVPVLYICLCCGLPWMAQE